MPSWTLVQTLYGDVLVESLLVVQVLSSSTMDEARVGMRVGMQVGMQVGNPSKVSTKTKV